MLVSFVCDVIDRYVVHNRKPPIPSASVLHCQIANKMKHKIRIQTYSTHIRTHISRLGNLHKAIAPKSYQTNKQTYSRHERDMRCDETFLDSLNMEYFNVWLHLIHHSVLKTNAFIVFNRKSQLHKSQPAETKSATRRDRRRSQNGHSLNEFQVFARNIVKTSYHISISILTYYICYTPFSFVIEMEICRCPAYWMMCLGTPICRVPFLR